MSKRNSDWYIPEDWHFHLGNLVMLGGIAVLGGVLMPLVARLKTTEVTALYGIGIGTGLVGILLLLIARLPLYRQRKFWTAGPRLLDRKHRRCYWIAYGFTILSLLLLCIVWLRTQ